MYAVFGVTGNTGSVVAEALLAAGQKVRVVVRDAKKAAAFEGRAEIAIADLSDVPAVTKALTGVAGAYLLSPPNAAATDFIQEKKVAVDRLAEAIDASGVPHVVFLSSIGGQHDAGTGVIRTVGYAERRLPKTKAKIGFVRAAYFQENWASVLGAAKQDGVLPTMFGPLERAIPMVATDDIGRTAANLLLDGPKARIVEVSGPTDYAPTDVARIVGAALQRQVTAVFVPPEARAPTLESFGISSNVAALYAEMNEGIENGKVAFAGNVESRRGLTPLAATVKRLLG